MSDRIRALWTNLEIVLNALEDAGENPTPGIGDWIPPRIVGAAHARV